MSTFAYDLKHWSQKHHRLFLDNKDLHFIQSVLDIKINDDEDIYSLIDKEKLLKVILEFPEQLPISAQLYFAILLKKTFKEYGIQNIPLIEYLTFLLTIHMKQDNKNSQNFYISDFVEQIEKANNNEKFYLRVELANKILFLSGLFEEHLNFRTNRRAAPSLSFYESIGCTQYEIAIQHPLASELHLKDTFFQLSHSFSSIRHILNQFSDRFITLGEPFNPNLDI